MENSNYQLHDYIIEKVKDFLKHDKIWELYRYLTLTWENIDDLVREIEEKITWEEEKKKIILLKKYIESREKREKDIGLIIKKTSGDLFDVLDDEKSKYEFDEKIINAFDILESWELYKFLKKLYCWKNIKDITIDIESRLNWKIDVKKFEKLEEYIDKRENYKKKLEKIKENTSMEIYDVMTERFEQFGRLSKLFSDWRKNPNLKFWEEYQKVLWGAASWNSIRIPDLENRDTWIRDETGNLSWDEAWDDTENGVESLKEYCLFNLIDRNSGQWFTLSNFINQNNISLWDRNSINYDLSNAISYICLDNFCEQEWFYRWKLFDSSEVIMSDEWQGNILTQGVIDFSKVKLENPSSMTCEECMKKIRNSIAHWDFMYLREDTWVAIYINDKMWFEAFIEPSFFDDWFCFGQYASDISCDFILWWKNKEPWKERIYEYQNRWESMPKLVNFLWPQFKENVTTIFDNRYNAIRINLNQQWWEKELEIIDSEFTQEPWLLFWLLSENERPYVHNLLNVISITMLDKIMKNPNVSYNELFDNLAIETICSERNLFTFQDRNKIIKLCLDMLPDLLMLQWLKVFYVNILDIPENNRTLEQREQAHIRNALIHWYYKIVKWKIIIWDFDRNRNIETFGKRIYDIETLWNDAKEYEKVCHSRENGFDSLDKWIYHANECKISV